MWQLGHILKPTRGKNMAGPLTAEAREFAIAYFTEFDKETLIGICEGQLGMACYDDEDKHDWVESIVDSLEAGDLEQYENIFRPRRGEVSANLYSLYLDIDETWQEDVEEDDTED